METARKAWPVAQLQAFTMRMAGHGFSVSRTLMKYDRSYALEQLQLAHCLADDELRRMATRLFCQFDGGAPCALAAAEAGASEALQ